MGRALLWLLVGLVVLALATFLILGEVAGVGVLVLVVLAGVPGLVVVVAVAARRAARPDEPLAGELDDGGGPR